jgi:hypothetical protein
MRACTPPMFTGPPASGIMSGAGDRKSLGATPSTCGPSPPVGASSEPVRASASGDPSVAGASPVAAVWPAADGDAGVVPPGAAGASGAVGALGSGSDAAPAVGAVRALGAGDDVASSWAGPELGDSASSAPPERAAGVSSLTDAATSGSAGSGPGSASSVAKALEERTSAAAASAWTRPRPRRPPLTLVGRAWRGCGGLMGALLRGTPAPGRGRVRVHRTGRTPGSWGNGDIAALPDHGGGRSAGRGTDISVGVRCRSSRGGRALTTHHQF